jgi:FkbM family methyltransferase
MNAVSTFVFSKLALISRNLPPFKGKVRACMSIFRALGGESLSTPQTAVLNRPIKHQMRLDLRAWAQRLAYVDGGYEPRTVEFLRELTNASVSPGYLLDVGACIGAITVPYAVLRRNESPLAVIAFEAVSDNAKLLRDNVRLNYLGDAVRVHEIALGDTSKIVDIQVEGNRKKGEGAGTANILADGTDYECVRQSIQILRLDDIDLPRGCGAIKIDTDGYDFKVLQGAEAFLARERPIIFGEFSAHCMRWHGQTVSDVQRFCETINYRLFSKIANEMHFVRDFPVETFNQDLLLVPEEKLNRVTPRLLSNETRSI